MTRPNWVKTLVIAIHSYFDPIWGPRLSRVLCWVFGHDYRHPVIFKEAPEFCVYCYKVVRYG